MTGGEEVLIDLATSCGAVPAFGNRDFTTTLQLLVGHPHDPVPRLPSNGGIVNAYYLFSG